MKNLHRTLLLHKHKIKLLEEYIMFSSNLIKKYHWTCNEEDINKLKEMCKKLDKVSKLIEDDKDATKS